MRGLAFRRHHDRRMRAKARRVLRDYFYSDAGNRWPKFEEWLHWSIVRRADNMQICSCRGCGNPRRHEKHGLTMQERRASDVHDD